jgi:hypothetical protein
VTLVIVLVLIGVLTLLLTYAAHRARCPVTPDHRHDWLYTGPTADPATHGPYPYDRVCLACGRED